MIVFCSAATLLSGCPADPVQAKLSAIQDRIFTPSCTFSTCHSAAGHAGTLVLEKGVARENLVGVLSAQEAAAGEGILRVAAGDPDRSFLVIKLRPRLPAKYGDHMPDTGGQLEDDQLAAIEEWIRRGAPDD